MKIVTGGQTGVDLSALEFASENGFACGGWVPKGRTNEAGRIPESFNGLTETQSEDVSERTKLNVRDCDALLVFLDGSPSPGTQLTINYAKEIGKSHLVVDVRQGIENCAAQVRSWLLSISPGTLNIAGPRASEAPSIGWKVKEILNRAFSTRSGGT